jgi:hypothetical protein
MAKALTILVCTVAAAVAIPSCLVAAAFALPSKDARSLLKNAPSLVVPWGYRPATFANSGVSASLDGTIRVVPGQAVQLTTGTAPAQSDGAATGGTSASPGGQSTAPASPAPAVTPSPTPTPKTDDGSVKGDKGGKNTDGDGGKSKTDGN